MYARMSPRLPRWWLALCLAHNLLLCIITSTAQICPALPAGAPELYGYNVVAEYPHDPKAFTQGKQQLACGGPSKGHRMLGNSVEHLTKPYNIIEHDTRLQWQQTYLGMYGFTWFQQAAVHYHAVQAVNFPVHYQHYALFPTSPPCRPSI
jgi:hypothetical protein